MEEKGLRVNAPLCSTGLSYRSGQQQHLLHINLIIGVHGAEELLIANRRVLDKGRT